MAPKQATLAYVKPSQTTLRNFLGTGTKLIHSAPEQSKLAFAPASSSLKAHKNSSSKSKDLPEENKEWKSDDRVDKAYSVQEERHRSPSVKIEQGTTSASNSASSPLRSSLEEPSAPSDSDGGPPFKRPRLRTSVDTTNNGRTSMTSTLRGGHDTEHHVKDSEGPSQRKQNLEHRIDSKIETSKNNTKGLSSLDSLHAKTQSKARNEDALAHSSPEDDSAERSEQEGEEEEEDSEGEKPRLMSKSRDLVQNTLSKKTNHAYPDWKTGEPVPYVALCTTFSRIEMTSKRLEISSHCSLFLRQVLQLTPSDLLPTILLMVNKLAADYTGIELGIGESLIMKAIGETTGRSLKVIKGDQAEIGDLGLVAAKSRSNQPTMIKPKPLTVRGVQEGLIGIATTEGQGAQARKIAGIKKLLSAADTQIAGKGNKGIDITKDKAGPSETKYIIRTLEGKMRLGLAEKTVLLALSHAMVLYEASQEGLQTPDSEKLAEGESILKSIYNELPSYEVIIPALLDHGIFNLRENCRLRPGVPLRPMLARPTKSISEVLDRFENREFTCEYKYDGERAQIHFVSKESTSEYATTAPTEGRSEKGVLNIFSRNSEDLSKKYPDILQKLPGWVGDGTRSFVLDCETVAWDVVEKKVLPFQQLMTRKRKDVKVEDVKVKVCVFAFDMLFFNGESLVSKPLRHRREMMHSALQAVEGEFAFATYSNIAELDEIQHLLEDSVKASCEGLMVKMLDGISSHYEPSRRSQNWLKVKKDYLSGAGDSLDLAVVGAYYGKGKRTSVYGAFLLACYNSTTQNFETVCNIGTGFSEALLEELHQKLSPLVIDRPKPFYSHSTVLKDQPDVWFEARVVWEVKNADFTLSPRYRAAADHLDHNKAQGKGISLRFPRFLRVREDKKAEQATHSREVANMYNSQEMATKKKGPSVDDDFEY